MNKPLTPDTDDFTIPSSPWLIVMNIGLLMIVAGTALPLLHVDAAVWRYIYCGAASYFPWPASSCGMNRSNRVTGLPLRWPEAPFRSTPR